MVSELSEGEILDYLMTSDFEEGLNPEEFKFLLFKFRNYYKKAIGNLSLEKDKIDSVIRNAEDSKRTIQNQIDEVLNQKKDMENKPYFYFHFLAGGAPAYVLEKKSLPVPPIALLIDSYCSRG